MGMAVPIYYTADMVRALPDDGQRYEVVRGELLVTPSPRVWHQVLVQRLSLRLGEYLERERAGMVLSSPADISWSADTLVQPDLFVVPLADVRTLEWAQIRDLRLVIEVLSPSTTRGDRFSKRRLYQEVGVPVYWIVDGEERFVEEWAPGAALPRVERERLVWTPAEAGQPFMLELAELFRPV
jgi:Uma2 family endonuclease